MGFVWPVEDPGGGEAVVRYRRAVDRSTGRAEARKEVDWLTAYNEADVRAVQAVRDFMAGGGLVCPPLPDVWPPAG